ncbi:hypothetical protein FIBSPDRAFT_899381 [Athelia psychrophila]|uniref:Uncharacterized protein n=1 Tax=Athelia psychrophila TaxID=1759441 RepID=A0A165ZU87_9AGAM|nr:hypothetical protein FIBSPDRAFT_899381 [Fibularhizoctonia sp. CBS 109695]
MVGRVSSRVLATEAWKAFARVAEERKAIARQSLAPRVQQIICVQSAFLTCGRYLEEAPKEQFRKCSACGTTNYCLKGIRSNVRKLPGKKMITKRCARLSIHDTPRNEEAAGVASQRVEARPVRGEQARLAEGRVGAEISVPVPPSAPPPGVAGVGAQGVARKACLPIGRLRLLRPALQDGREAPAERRVAPPPAVHPQTPPPPPPLPPRTPPPAPPTRTPLTHLPASDIPLTPYTSQLFEVKDSYTEVTVLFQFSVDVGVQSVQISADDMNRKYKDNSTRTRYRPRRADEPVSTNPRHKLRIYPRSRLLVLDPRRLYRLHIPRTLESLLKHPHTRAFPLEATGYGPVCVESSWPTLAPLILCGFRGTISRAPAIHTVRSFIGRTACVVTLHIRPLFYLLAWLGPQEEDRIRGVYVRLGLILLMLLVLPLREGVATSLVQLRPQAQPDGDVEGQVAHLRNKESTNLRTLRKAAPPRARPTALTQPPPPLRKHRSVPTPKPTLPYSRLLRSDLALTYNLSSSATARHIVAWVKSRGHYTSVGDVQASVSVVGDEYDGLCSAGAGASYREWHKVEVEKGSVLYAEFHRTYQLDVLQSPSSPVQP